MKRALLSLGGAASDVSLEVAIARRSNVLSLSYVLAGNLSGVAIPAPTTASATAPSRKDGLWENTCFEFFVAPRDAAPYWEFNLAPSGDWNVYHFDDYRQGRRPEPSFAELPFSVRRQSWLALDVKVGLDIILPAHQPIQLAVSAVIKRTDNTLTYWALAHGGPEADFHLRASFIVGC